MLTVMLYQEADEVAALAAEADMLLEELLARYGHVYSAPSPAPAAAPPAAAQITTAAPEPTAAAPAAAAAADPAGQNPDESDGGTEMDLDIVGDGEPTAAAAAISDPGVAAATGRPPAATAAAGGVVKETPDRSVGGAPSTIGGAAEAGPSGGVATAGVKQEGGAEAGPSADPMDEDGEGLKGDNLEDAARLAIEAQPTGNTLQTAQVKTKVNAELLLQLRYG